VGGNGCEPSGYLLKNNKVPTPLDARISSKDCRPRKKTPGLTLDMAVRLLRTALARPRLTLSEAIAILEYHLERNRIAKQSHYKTWRERHKKVPFKVLL
jgi:hypothetical protein